MVVDGFGLHAKLVGSVRPDPVTGQVSVHFEELPQVPFNRFDLHLFSSDRGLMATPTVCTIYKTEASFVQVGGEARRHGEVELAEVLIAVFAVQLQRETGEPAGE